MKDREPETGPCGAVDFRVREETLGGWPVRVTSYTIAGVAHCHVDNVSPGAVFARASGNDPVKVERVALEKATARLAHTHLQDPPGRSS